MQCKLAASCFFACFQIKSCLTHCYLNHLAFSLFSDQIMSYSLLPQPPCFFLVFRSNHVLFTATSTILLFPCFQIKSCLTQCYLNHLAFSLFSDQIMSYSLLPQPSCFFLVFRSNHVLFTATSTILLFPCFQIKSCLIHCYLNHLAFSLFSDQIMSYSLLPQPSCFFLVFRSNHVLFTATSTILLFPCFQIKSCLTHCYLNHPAFCLFSDQIMSYSLLPQPSCFFLVFRSNHVLFTATSTILLFPCFQIKSCLIHCYLNHLAFSLFPDQIMSYSLLPQPSCFFLVFRSNHVLFTATSTILLFPCFQIKSCLIHCYLNHLAFSLFSDQIMSYSLLPQPPYFLLVFRSNHVLFTATSTILLFPCFQIKSCLIHCYLNHLAFSLFSDQIMSYSLLPQPSCFFLVFRSNHVLFTATSTILLFPCFQIKSCLTHCYLNHLAFCLFSDQIMSYSLLPQPSCFFLVFRSNHILFTATSTILLFACFQIKSCLIYCYLNHLAFSLFSDQIMSYSRLPQPSCFFLVFRSNHVLLTVTSTILLFPCFQIKSCLIHCYLNHLAFSLFSDQIMSYSLLPQPSCFFLVFRSNHVSFTATSTILLFPCFQIKSCLIDCYLNQLAFCLFSDQIMSYSLLPQRNALLVF